MANTKSAKKAVRTIARREERNKSIRTTVKSVVKKTVAAVQEGAKDLEQIAREAVSALDKAAAKGVLHKNKAARKKSRLAKRLNKATAKA